MPHYLIEIGNDHTEHPVEWVLVGKPNDTFISDESILYYF